MAYTVAVQYNAAVEVVVEEGSRRNRERETVEEGRRKGERQ
jgi:hypothetical protein